MTNTITSILLAEDDQDFGSILKQYLELHLFKVYWFKDGKTALTGSQEHSVSICLLDVMMPKLDGFTLAEKIIEQDPNMPFLFLTARGEKEDKIKGLKLGADDYIVKPFEADELVLRINNILKRHQHNFTTTTVEKFKIGEYMFNPNNLLLEHQGHLQRLTEKESKLLEFLVNHKNQLISRPDILKAVWGQDDFFSGRSMDVFISKLRKHLSKDSNIIIESVRGQGLEFKLNET